MKLLPKINHLIAFRQVVHSGSIRAAAQELGLSQPGMSRTLRDLEQTLGTQLILRSSTGVTLTEAGKAFFQRGEWILEELQRATDEVYQINHFSQGKLTIGYSSLVALTVFPEVIEKFTASQPRTEIKLKEGQLSSLIPSIYSGEIDIAIGSIEPMNIPKDIMVEPLFTAPFSIIARKNHPLATVTDLFSLRKAKWLLPESSMGYYQQLQHELMSFYNQLSITPLRSDSFVTALNLVLESDYLTIVARAMYQPLGIVDRITELPVTTLPAAQYCVVWSKKSTLTANATQFLKILRTVCQKYEW